MPPEISAVVLAKNDEDTIDACLASLNWANEIIVVVDAASTDKTRDLAGKHTSFVYTHQFSDFSEQRNFGLHNATKEWVWCNDSDERTTPQLQDEIRKAVEQDTQVGYWVPYLNYVLGKTVRHGRWHPDLHLRLFRKEGVYFANRIHEVPITRGSLGYLQNAVMHYTFPSLSERCEKMRLSSELLAQELIERQASLSVLKAPQHTNSWYSVYRQDGWRGILVEVFDIVEMCMTYQKARQLQKQA
ncbi:MAG TPA: glycosyltransferase family 2 protein [Candidatus Nanoarchaeia archaeon]|nr:glycosyltransferase family 2 protein [Candidatus Nanoarchaeia archaeon]